MTFTGFPSAGLALLERLPSLDRDQFQAARDEYRSGIVEPSRAFVDALGPRLRSTVFPGITFGAGQNQSIAPIHNDRRFIPDGALYKDQLLFRFWEGSDKYLAPTLFVRITPHQLGFAAGMRFSPAQLCAYRSAVDAHGAELTSAIGWLEKWRNADVAPHRLARVPRPYPDDHPYSELLRHKSVQVRWTIDPGNALSRSGLVGLCRDQLVRAAPVHRWLVRHVVRSPRSGDR